MKKKLLFWINGFMLHFALSYYLQQKLKDDFYAIIDVPNNPRKMFDSQSLVNFKKTWYFHDHIDRTKSKPDLEYLVNFEKNYHINLWLLAINERHFYKFNRFYKFTKNEILVFLEQECKLFEQILDEVKPDFLLTYEPPLHHQKLLVDMCRAKGIKILCIHFARLGGKSIIAQDGKTLDLPQDLSFNYDITNRLKQDSSYFVISKNYVANRMPTILNKVRALVDYLLISDSKNTKTNFTYYGRKKHKVISDAVSLAIKKQVRTKFMQKNLQSNPDLNKPYVYLALNVDEEASLFYYSPFFTDQVEVIRHVAKSLPVDHMLYVKDHIHSVFRSWRSIKECKEIMEIPNVILIHPSYSSLELTKHSKMVVTVRGTASFEAACEGKPSIVFGDVPFSILPSVHKVDSLSELPDLIRTCLNSKVDISYAQKYIELIDSRSVDFSMMDFEVKRNHHFYSGNILSDINITEENVKQFLENNKEYFESLTSAHLTKINCN
jgi:hypothetical protein